MQVYFQSLIRSYFPRVPIILTTSVYIYIYIYIYITDPRLLGALRKLCWGLDETHLCPRIALKESAPETVSLPRLGKTQVYNYYYFFLVRARDCTTFTLHDLADFYVERAF